MSWEYHGDPRPDIQALIDVRGRSVLDVGCAAGVLGAALKERGARHVTGIEYVQEVAERARERLDRVITGSVLEEELPFACGEFDVIVCADVLEHLTSPEAALARLLPFLAPDGVLVISVPNIRFYTVLARLLLDRWEYTDAGIRDRTHLRLFTRRVLLDLLHGAGLKVDRLERNYRLMEDQSQIGRFGALATRVARRTIAPLLFRDLMAFQFVAVASRR